MDIKLSVLRDDKTTADVVVSSEPQATVSDVATALWLADPAAPQETNAIDLTGVVLTLAVVAAEHAHQVDPELPFAESAVPSGGVVRVVRHLKERPSMPMAIVTVLHGPDAGSHFRITAATSTIGRADECEIQLHDALVSRRHAQLLITGTVHIIDLNSANGMLISGVPVRRAELGPNDTIVLGESTIQVRSTGGLDAQEASAGRGVRFNRSPQVRVTFNPTTTKLPKPPDRTRPRRFPILVTLLPLVLAAALYTVMPSPFFLIFFALGPLMMVAQWLEDRNSSRREFRAALAEHHKDLIQFDIRLAELRDEERTLRQLEHPDLTTVIDAIRQRNSMLWSRQPGHRGWLEVRGGLGARPSRIAIELPSRGDVDLALWQSLEQRLESGELIDSVPIVISLPIAGTVGVAGERDVAQSMAQALVLQFVALHSPAELLLAVMTDGEGEQRWGWTRWLPHTSTEVLALPQQLAADEAVIRQLLAALEELVLAREASEQTLPSILVVWDDGAVVDRARMAWLARRGPATGIHLLHSAPTSERLLAECGCFLTVKPSDPHASLGDCVEGEYITPIQWVPTSDLSLESLARAFSPVVDATAAGLSGADLPASAAFVPLAGPELVQDSRTVRERWARTEISPGQSDDQLASHRQLSALVGLGAEGPFYLDLRAHGPHALVGGTTGAGKSEFLQTWVISLATTYSPRRLAFLFVDYKGGAAFGHCVRLPHSVGMITDLTPALFSRTLISLRAELRRRERILAEHGAKDLMELEGRNTPGTPPNLVIVVDEFAALVHDVPDFVDGMVDIAQRGRSLGVHLILATQRPAGVIRENLRANTNLRIALRLADTADSVDVLGSGEAAQISSEVPGRGYAKTGPGRLTAFQTAYAGGWTSDTAPAPRIEIQNLSFGNQQVWRVPGPPVATPIQRSAPTDLQRMVDVAGAAARLGQITRPPSPWLPPLAANQPWEQLHVSDDVGKLPIAQRDDPELQDQYGVAFDPDKEGHLAVFGTGGSGKSTVLRTIATAALLGTEQNGPTHVYGLDFGAQGLNVLARLPHVGAVISGDDTERLNRLLRRLTIMAKERAHRYAGERADSLTQYRTSSGHHDEPRILLLVDGAQSFRQQHEGRGLNGPWEKLVDLAAEGRSVGIHVVLSADRPLGLPGALQSALQKRLYLRMVEEDYLNAGMSSLILSPTAPPGRGHLDGYEVQVGVYRGESSISRQAADLDQLLRERDFGYSGARAPEPVEMLPEVIPLSSLPSTIEGLPVIGRAESDLQPVPVNIRSTFLIAGSPGSGRTTCLATIAAAALRSERYTQAFHLGTTRSQLSTWVPWMRSATGAEIVALATELAVQLDTDTAPRTVVVVEDLLACAGLAESALLGLAKVCVERRHAFVTDVDLAAKLYSELAMVLKAGRQGLVLRPQTLIDGQGVLGTNTPPPARSEVPGRGVLVSEGQTTSLQVAITAPGPGAVDWV